MRRDIFPARPSNPPCVPIRAFLLLLGVCLLAGWLAVPLLAQDDDVHITPRETKKADATAAARHSGRMVDPALRTHTKPVRKDVDLVLVPVTITDPMNRLVTGLEKENFAAYRQRPAAADPALLQRRRARFRWA